MNSKSSHADHLVSCCHILNIFKEFYFFPSYIAFPLQLTIDSVWLKIILEIPLSSPMLPFLMKMIEKVLLIFFFWAPSPKIFLQPGFSVGCSTETAFLGVLCSPSPLWL